MRKPEKTLVHFSTSMDLCHLKHSGWQNIYKYTKDESCFLETNVKDDTGRKVVFSEQGASASQVTAAQVSDTTSRLSGLVGEANDAVSACSQEKGSMLPGCSSFQRRNAPQLGCGSLVIVVQQSGAQSMLQQCFTKASSSAIHQESDCGSETWKQDYCSKIGNWEEAGNVSTSIEITNHPCHCMTTTFKRWAARKV